MRSAARALVALVIVAFAGCEAVSTPFGKGTGALVGRVVQDGEPQADVLVWVGGDGERDVVTTRTDAAGGFRLEGLAAGLWRVSALAERADARDVRVTQDRVVDVGELALVEPACVAGVLRLADGAVPSPVEIEHVATGRWTWSRPDGRFALSLPAGRHAVRLRGMNLVDAEAVLDVAPGATCADEPAASVVLTLA